MLTISTPMRPNRPHIPSTTINFKERGHKITRSPELRASCHRVSKFRYERLISLPSASRLHRCVCFASVRRCLGKAAETRKRKNAQLRHFLVTLNVYRGFPYTLPPRQAEAAKAAAFGDKALIRSEPNRFCRSVLTLVVRPQTAEIQIRIALMNRFLALGTAEIVRLA